MLRRTVVGQTVKRLSDRPLIPESYSFVVDVRGRGLCVAVNCPRKQFPFRDDVAAARHRLNIDGLRCDDETVIQGRVLNGNDGHDLSAQQRIR